MTRMGTAALISLFLWTACGGGSGGNGDAATSDAASDDAGDAGSVCVSDSDCDDGLFCNGAETCSPSDPTANVNGCAPASDPCLADQSCDETSARCLTDCDTTGDADGDGHDSVDCGGDDCDDADRNRFPGNTEVCDGAKHDEDCDPTSFGERDVDRDGYADVACCNVDAAGMDVCGTDCADTLPNVHPTATEACNRVDDDCNGMIDEGLDTDTYHPDCDGDGYGAAGSAGVVGCGRPLMDPACAAPTSLSTWAPNEADCNDELTAVNPATVENTCNGVDDNCDGALDLEEDRDQDGYANILCGGSDCDDDNRATYVGAAELCDRLDNDCSMTGAAAGGVDLSEDEDGDEHAPVGASCTGGFPTDDCDDSAPAVYGGSPGAPELCDEIDNDCDGVIDEDPDPAAIAADSSNCGGCGLTCMLVCAAAVCDEAVQVVTGSSHSCALRTSGQVVCWGDNSKGQLGNGQTPTDLPFSAVPVAVSGLTDAVEISAGDKHTCARRSSGQLVCWGDNAEGQFGDGSRIDSAVPVAVSDLMDAVEISAGDKHTCARRASGQLVCWGANGAGQLGDTTTVRRLVPTAVSGLTDAAEVSAGGLHTCARRASGVVLCWGANLSGQLGDGTTAGKHAPSSTLFPADTVEISAGLNQSCVRRSGGGVWCSGYNGFGQLGDGTTTSRDVPRSVSGLADAVQIRTRSGHTCARRATGQAVCWGYNASGQLGDGGTSGSLVPVNVSGLGDSVDIDVGKNHSCALRASGQVVCWGRNSEGQLGDGTSTPSSTPVDVTRM
ncbi:MAG: hypothetical protein GXP55_15805 [Deltaproteobacteria bacterium]|nr:hypothetical protein [Deltaproteobacteria bacterium]